MARSASAACPSWPLWQTFKTLYISSDGRAIDASTASQITTSEGQSYAMLLALAANDRAVFAQLLQWTENNLAKGDLGKTLPAWQWGRNTHQQWQVLDDNSASDADVWLAYSLSEAGRLWREPRYTQLAQALSATILREEITLVAGLGPALLPGVRGFVREQTWRFNASYLPLQALRLLAREHNPLWNDIAASSLRIIIASAPRGYATDWIEYRSDHEFDRGFITDRTTHGLGSYEAIRVYLWAGMLAPTDPDFDTINRQLAPALRQFAQQTHPAERIDTTTLTLQGTGSPGFSAAYLPLLKTNQQMTALAQQLERTRQSLTTNQAYYSDVLTLFGRGWLEGWLRFAASGRLQVKWSSTCTR